MTVVWKFYCGLIGLKPNSSFQDQIYLIFTSHYADSLYRVHCAFESQQILSYDVVLDCVDQFALLFEKKILNLVDYIAMGHVISKASRPTLGLRFYLCNLFKKSTPCEIIKSYANFQEPDINWSNARPENVAALAEGCKFCINLQTLNICMNNIGSKGAAALVKDLKSCINLQTLDVSWNNIGSDGAAALAEGLKFCTSLKELDVSWNDIGSESAAAIVVGLKFCTNLKVLNISSNNIGSDEAAALAETVKSYNILKVFL